MNPILQFWLLNLAADFGVPFRCLPPILDGRDDQATVLNVKSLHGFSLDYTLTSLVELSDSGLIRFAHYPDEQDERVTSSEVLAMTRRGIRPDLSFELTPSGGEAWEKMAEPRWYDMDAGSAVPVEGSDLVRWDWTFFSQNRDRLIAILGWFPSVEAARIELDTVNWKCHKDYQVRYWKSLPNVHVATFQSHGERDLRLSGGPEWFHSWNRARSHWYRRPWDLDGWPPVMESEINVPGARPPSLL